MKLIPIFILHDIEPGAAELGLRLLSHDSLKWGKCIGASICLLKWEIFLGVGW
jgi:hypothetical protein